MISIRKNAFGSFLKLNRGAQLGLVIVFIFTFIGIFSPLIAPFRFDQIFSEALKSPAFWQEGAKAGHWLGTDDLGRDLLTRLIFGARISMGIGFFVVLFSLFWGVLLGLVAGSLGGWVDQVLSRFIDILMALPSMLMAIVVISILGPSLANTVIAVGIVAIPPFFRLVRSAVLVEMNKNYVTACRSFGANWWRLAVINVLPNCGAPIIVQASLGFSEGILNAAALGFLGLGAQPPLPEWGTMLSDARSYIESSPMMVTLPGLCILIVVVGFNLIGDSLRDSLDPRLRR